MNRTALILLIATFWLSLVCYAPADTDQQARNDISQINHRLNNLERDINNIGSGGGILFLFGAFCALWAQNTGRSAWLWFFLGLFFSIIAVLVLLSKNSEHIVSHRKGFDINQFKEQ